MQFNPILQTNAPSTFGVSWDGLTQGVAMPDPAVRFQLAGGTLDTAETVPVWGGVGISENVPANPVANIAGSGGRIAIATNLTGGATLKTMSGFSVFDQAYGMINSPQSPVPLASGGMQVMFYRFGSLARLALKMDPTLAAALYDKPITQPVSWDFATQQIVAFATTGLPVKILKIYPSSCMTVNYNAGSGFATWNYNGAAALVMI
jgi:hypothetical protein